MLISPAGIAHRHGCLHLPDYPWLVPPRWGWVEDSAVWPRIGAHSVQATHGNNARIAERRCLDCDESY